jgi:hypothetical protein
VLKVVKGNLEPMKNNRIENTRESGRGRIGSSGGKTQDHVAIRIACRGNCKYFKGMGGEQECGGFAAVSKALASGTITAIQMESVPTPASVPSRRVKILTEKLCETCGYLKDACDFQSPAPPEGAAPCGGYRIFQTLLDSGEIKEDDLEKILYGPTSNV